MGRLKGKIALVTGGASGLGRADVEAMLREGARVVFTDLNEKAGREAEAALSAAHPGNVKFLVQDVRDEQRWTEVVAETARTFGGLNVLVNNAGIVIVATPESTTLEQFRLANAVMSEGVFLGCRAAIPQMRESGGGSIVNMASVATHLGYPVFFAYAAAKGAVRAMTKAIAVHCQANRYGIRCNSIHAGAIETPMISQANAELGMQMSDHESAPWGLGKPADVAGLVVYLASDESRFVNGTEIVIDNALTIQ